MTSKPIPKLESQPIYDGELVFNAPWEAKTFAMTVHLNEKGVFSWKEWANTLSLEISNHESKGAAVDGDSYYRLWQRALEKILASKIQDI